MGYLHINNLYKEQEILGFKECYALEKIHGTSAHIKMVTNETYSMYGSESTIEFFPGGVSQASFEKLFDKEKLQQAMAAIAPNMIVYGEAYGGSCQKMSATYGPDLKFVAFDVQINDMWLAVPDAEEVCKQLGIEFVHYVLIRTDVEIIDQHRDAPSVQAQRNGMGNDKKREGVVLRPIREYTKNNGSRVIVKHKGAGFEETKTPRVVSEGELQVLADAAEVANEWVTQMRFEHVLDKIPGADMTKMRDILKAMHEDVRREGEGEIVWSQAVEKAISNATVRMVKEHFTKVKK